MILNNKCCITRRRFGFHTYIFTTIRVAQYVLENIIKYSLTIMDQHAIQQVQMTVAQYRL